MATTTVLNADYDTRLMEGAPTTNFNTNPKLRAGYTTTAGGSSQNSILEFDVSAFTTPADIVSANLKLTSIAEWGTAAKPIIISRCIQEFVSSQATWNIYKTGSNWDTAGGDGAITSEPTYTIYAGDSSGTQTVDIIDLVKDAIMRRSGILRILLSMSQTTVTALAEYASTNHSTSAYHPILTVKVSERVVWVGDINTDIDDALNWSGGVPAANDIALFPSGSNPARAGGTLRCQKVLVGKNYKGDIGLAATPVELSAIVVNLSSRHTNFYANINEGGSAAEVRVADAQSTGVEIDGVYSAILTRTRGSIDLKTTDATTIDAHGSQIQFTTDDDLTTVRCTGSRAILGDGATTIIAVNRATLTIESVNYTSSDLTLSQSNVWLLAAEVNDITQYSGTTIFRQNEGSPIVVNDIILFGGTFDTRTQSATFTMNGATIHGGRFLVDGSQLVTVA